MDIIIRKLTPDDSEDYQRVRLEGLRLSPDAFGSTYEEEVHFSDDQVRGRLDNGGENFVLGAFDGNSLIGMAMFRRDSKLKFRHRGGVYATYVTPTWQNRGVARKLLTDLIERAKNIEALEQLHLSVLYGNAPGKRLYESIGFVVYGHVPHATKHQGRYHDDELMVLFLKVEPV